MTNIRSFRELRVWQAAMDAAMRVFEVTRRFPAEEKFSLTDQVRRSSRSVPANISEAWRKRRYPAAFVSKLNDAEGEAAETQTHIEVALRRKHPNPGEARALDDLYEQIPGMLVTMVSRPEEWTVRPGNEKREVSSSVRDTATRRSRAEPSPRPRVAVSPRHSTPP
jgi:four helix bundle protein